MARRTLKYPVRELYPGLAGLSTERGILDTVAQRYPGLPPCTRRSVVADLLRSVILTGGGRGKRGTVAHAEVVLAPWLDKLDYGTNIAPGQRLPSTRGKAQAQLRRDLFATYDAAMKAAEGCAARPGQSTETQAPSSSEQDCGGCQNGEHCGACKCCPDEQAQDEQTRAEAEREGEQSQPFPQEADRVPQQEQRQEAPQQQQGGPDRPREITTKYRGRCEACGGPTIPGERVQWTGKGKVRHLHCVEQRQEQEAPSTVPAAPEVQATRGDPLRDYLAWSQRCRAVCEQRNADGHRLDDWSMRPTLDGLKLIRQGCPIEAVQDAVTMHWPKDARDEVGAREYDFNAHGITEYLLKASAARVPLFLIGPKGTGKTTHAKGLADALGTAFGMVSVTAGTSPSAFYGRPIIGSPTGEVVPSRFETIYREGGVYLFDEIDAADPNILLIVNAALADGGQWSNPQTGEEWVAHPDFIPVAAGNTIGLGADRDYTARDRLDAATLDRFCAGRVRVKLDESLEASLAERIIAGGDSC